MAVRILLSVGCVILVLGAVVSRAPRSVEACSADISYDPVGDADVIVAGRFAGWELIPDALSWNPKTDAEPVGDPNYYGPYDAIRVKMNVELVYKGSRVVREIEMVAGNTVRASSRSGNLETQWLGSSGACGAFDFDPTGKYGILGLHVDQFDRYVPHLLGVFYIGDDPPTDFNSPKLVPLARLLPGELPTSGGNPGPPVPVLPTLGAALAAIAIAAGVAWGWAKLE